MQGTIIKSNINNMIFTFKKTILKISKFVRNLFKIQYILYLIFLLTIVYFIFNPRFIYEKGQYFLTSYNEIDYATQFATIPNNSQYDIIYINQSTTCTYINYYNEKENGTFKKRLYNFSPNTLLGGLLSECYYDTLNHKIFTILTSDDADYYLFELYNDENPTEIKKDKIFHYNIYDSMLDTNIIVNNVKFNSFEVENDLENLCELTPYKDGYKLKVSGRVRDSIFPQKESININNAIYDRISSEISILLNILFTQEDIFKIMQFFLRKDYYDWNYFRNKFPNRGFLPAKIAGAVDINNDGHEEILILIYGNEYIYNLLICFDTVSKSILWENRYYRTPEQFIIQDIDNDKIEEIIIGFSHSDYNLPVEWFKKNPNKYNDGDIVILNNNGTIKLINKRPALLNLPGEPVSTIFSTQLNDEGILMGYRSNGELLEQRFIFWNLIINEIDSLNILCNNFIGFCKNKSYIRAFSYCNKKIIMKLISLDIELKKTYKNKIQKRLHSILSSSKKILNNKYYISLPLSIISQNLNLIYDCPYNAVKNHISITDNNLFFIEQRKGFTYLSRINFIENRKINPYAILIISLEILIIVSFFFIINFISFPISSGISSYLIVISVIDKIHFWRIYGKMRAIYKLPRHMSLKRNSYLNIVRSLSNNHRKVVFQKKNLIFNYTVYELISRDELIVIRHIVHELKNKILLIKMIINNKNKLNSNASILSILDYISKIAVTLSNLTRIETLYKEKVEMNQYLKQILSEYINHPHFTKIEFVSGISNEYFYIDKQLFKIALRNLINNAIESITNSKQIIKIKVLIVDSKLHVDILNPGHLERNEIEKIYEIGYTTKNEGSGLGIPISKIIIENHNGILSISSDDNTIMVRIILPKE